MERERLKRVASEIASFTGFIEATTDRTESHNIVIGITFFCLLSSRSEKGLKCREALREEERLFYELWREGIDSLLRTEVGGEEYTSLAKYLEFSRGYVDENVREIYNRIYFLLLDKDIDADDDVVLFRLLLDALSSSSRKATDELATPHSVCRLIASIIDIKDGESLQDLAARQGEIAFQCAGGKKVDIALKVHNINNYCFTLMIYLLMQGDTSEVRYEDVLISEFEPTLSDVVVTNFPFSRKLPSETRYGNPLNWNYRGLGADFLYIMRSIDSLNHKGRAVIVVPQGVLFRGGKEKELREWITKQGLLKAVINLPPNLFKNTAVPVTLLVIDKRTQNKSVIFIDANHRKKAKTGSLEQVDIDWTLQALNGSVNDKSASATIKKMETNNYSWQTNQYLNLKVNKTKNLLDLKAEIAGMEREFIQVSKQLNAQWEKLEERDGSA
ncbi:MAG: N-6 DNA methylase [Spongiibacteraceae bacterium]|nr:N-6 DNA methylase [Spongiibacteraceae bacterium]